MNSNVEQYQYEDVDSAHQNEGFEDIIPYNKVIDGKWWMLSPSPIGGIIKERFSHYYSGKLTWREINAIKEKMDNYQKKIDEHRKKCSNNRKELAESLKKEKELCNEDCAKKLNAHIDICKSSHKCDEICASHRKCYTCDENYVAYDCQFKENGRCSHYYDIKHIEERLENYDYPEDEYTDSYMDYQVEYERALAIKEDRYDEYRRNIESYFD